MARKKDEYARLTATVIADLWGVSAQAVGLWHSRDQCPRNRDKTYNLREVIQWREDRLRSANDDGLVGPDSPALERYRDEKAKLAQLDRFEREGKLLPRDLVHEKLGRLGLILRRAGEQLQRKYGPDAQQTLDEALDDFEREIASLEVKD